MKIEIPIISLTLSSILSNGGTRFSIIAVPWLVLTATNDAMLMGLVGLAEMLPYVVAKAMSGPLIDRIGARVVAIWSDLLSTVAIALMPVLVWADMLEIWLLLPLVGLIGILRGPSDAAKQSMIPMVAESTGASLERVTGAVGAGERLAGALGAAGAGILVGLSGPATALVANSVAFLLSAVVLLVWMPAARGARQSQSGKVGYVAELSSGVAVLRRDPVLIVLVVMLAFTNFFDQAYATVLLPVWVKSSGFDASWIGIFLGVFSGSAILGAAAAAAAASRLPRLAIYVSGFIFAGPIPMAVLASSAPVPVILAVLLCSGAAAGFLGPVVGAILFERIPAALTGRVIALVGSLAWALMPFGGLYAGFLFERLGITLALAVTGFFYLVVVLAPLSIPAFRAVNVRLVGRPG